MGSSAASIAVLFLTPWYPSRSAPRDGLFIREHARSASHVAEVAVLHLGPAGRDALPMRESDDGDWGSVRVYHMPSTGLRLPKTASLGYIVSALRGLRWMVQDGFEPDVVHAHVFGVAVAARVLGRVLRRPVVLSEHSSTFAVGGITRTGLGLARVILKRLDLVLPVSDALRRAMLREGIRARYRVVPNAVDLDVFHPGHTSEIERGQILFVGRLADGKGLGTLLEAFAGIEDEGTSLAIVGDGPLRDELARRAASLGISSRVSFRGPLTHSEVAEAMRTSSLLVLPSDPWESLPCVVIEGLASGLPIVATRVGGVEEVVDASTSVLVPPANVDALRRGMIGALAGTEEVDRSGMAQAARRFSRRNIAQELLDVYREVLAC